MTGGENSDYSAKRILVVDDNEMSRKLIEHRLTRDGFTVVSASSGEAALEGLARVPADLMLLDLVMDGMSGLDVLNIIKNDARLSHFPVVIVSGIEDVDAVNKCIAAGAVDFLPKPVQPDALSEIVDDLLGGGSHKTGAAGRQVAAEDAQSCMSDLPLFEPARVVQLCTDFGKDKVSEFIAQFEGNAPKLLAAIADDMNKDCAEARSIAAHTLKGSARTFGLLRLAAISRDMEKACDEGRLDDADTAAKAIDRYFDASLKALLDYAADM
ncbi:MAG: response regulator [Rhodospirillales bacterium]|nr:response regulator [Rhodospirillales bacterium]MDP6646717.1 response regulator [Rhodospirillales bacterium]MDP6840574.1 response regulator [Rhodospirillales bacterium]